MPEAVYRMLTLLCDLVELLPVDTHLGMLHLLWMLVSGRLLEALVAVRRWPTRMRYAPINDMR